MYSRNSKRANIQEHDETQKNQHPYCLTDFHHHFGHVNHHATVAELVAPVKSPLAPALILDKAFFYCSLSVANLFLPLSMKSISPSS